jgi:uncharacterized repeat protein (TIGR03943 family)
MTKTAFPTERPLNWAALVETFLLTTTGVMLFAKAQSGVLAFYIHPRYTPLIVLCAICLLLIAGTRMRGIFGSPPEPLRARYLILLLPVLLGTLVPAQPLGAEAIGDPSLGAVTQLSADPQDDDTLGWNLLQWATALSVRGETLDGKEADLIGFVYHDPARPLDGFFVVRYVITCCTADGNGVGLPVVWRGGDTLPTNSWVRVRAHLATATIAGQAQSALVATAVESVAQPTDPYLYP